MESSDFNRYILGGYRARVRVDESGSRKDPDVAVGEIAS